MRLSLKVLVPLALAALGAPATAQDHQASVPGKADGLPWRVLQDSDRQASFLAVIGRNGDVARISTMVVFKDPTEDEDGVTYDAFSEAVAVHCPTGRFRTEQFETVANGIRNPPPLIRLPFDPADADPASFIEAAPVAGTMGEAVVSVACGDRVMRGEQVTNPYRWARGRFGKAAAQR